jgi:hypothetical protein
MALEQLSLVSVQRRASVMIDDVDILVMTIRPRTFEPAGFDEIEISDVK